jgi:hypothetical protein
MNIRQLPNRLEISFWSTIISIMSEAPDLSRLLLMIREFTFSEKSLRFLTRLFIWSILGWALGFILGVFSSTLTWPLT